MEYIGVILGKKIKTSIAIDEELLSWIDKLIDSKRFANRTHAIEYALQRLREREREELHI
jgi:Arc/MetJ-type ribon-helix-helix transcriptional regulator